MSIIYKATNLINGKIYISQTKNTLDKRIINHFSKCGKDTIYFHFALNKYGRDNFKWEIIHRCDNIDELNQKEEYYIKEYNSTNREIGYNTSLGKYKNPFEGWTENRWMSFKKKISILSSNRSEETKLKMSNSQKKKKNE